MAALALGALLGLFVALWDPLGALAGPDECIFESRWVHLWVYRVHSLGIHYSAARLQDTR